MKKETYEAVFARICASKHGKRLLIAGGRFVVAFTAAGYVFTLGYCIYAAQKAGEGKTIFSAGFFVLLGVPALSFLLVSLFRARLNAKRPYEVYEFVPLLSKDTRGKSFPSRHVFSCFVIGTSALFVCPVIGSVLLLLGVFLGISRVLLGVHFIRDVAAGAAIGIAFGLLSGVLFSL